RRGAPRVRPSFPTRRSSDLRGGNRRSSRDPTFATRTGSSTIRAAGSRTSASAARVTFSDDHEDDHDQVNAAWTREEDPTTARRRSEEHTSELQSRENLVCRL